MTASANVQSNPMIAGLIILSFSFINYNYNFFSVNNNTSMTASLLDKHPNCRYYEIIYKYLSSNNLIK